MSEYIHYFWKEELPFPSDHEIAEFQNSCWYASYLMYISIAYQEAGLEAPTLAYDVEQVVDLLTLWPKVSSTHWLPLHSFRQGPPNIVDIRKSIELYSSWRVKSLDYPYLDSREDLAQEPDFIAFTQMSLWLEEIGALELANMRAILRRSRGHGVFGYYSDFLNQEIASRQKFIFSRELFHRRLNQNSDDLQIDKKALDRDKVTQHYLKVLEEVLNPVLFNKK